MSENNCPKTHNNNMKKELQPHQQRVIEEKAQLDEKLEKLTKFIDSPDFIKLVPDTKDRDLLVNQEEAMLEYSDILADRIVRFSK